MYRHFSSKIFHITSRLQICANNMRNIVGIAVPLAQYKLTSVEPNL